MIIDQLFTRPIFEEAAMASPEQLAYNRLRAQYDSYQTMTGGGGNTAVSRDPAHAAKLATIPAEIARMAAALKAKGIDAEAQYDALSGPAAAPVDANQAYGGVSEVAPPGAKAERMVKHIKQGYAKDGKLTPKEKGIAFATAWKAHNAGQVEEATDPKRDKLERMIWKYYGQIYDYGDDDGLDYLDRNGELWNQLMDKYNGEIDDIVAQEPTEVLMQAAQELKGIAGDMKYELDEQDMAEGVVDTVKKIGKKLIKPVEVPGLNQMKAIHNAELKRELAAQNKKYAPKDVKEGSGDVVQVHQHQHGKDMGKYGAFNIERETPKVIVVYDHNTGEMLKFNRVTGRGIGPASQLMIRQGAADGLPGSLSQSDYTSGPRGINLPSAPTKKFFTDKQKWMQAVDDINHSKYDDNSDYTGVTGRSTVSIDGREWARWSDAQQKGYIDMGSMSEQGVAEAAKWRSDPDAYDVDDEGNKTPRNPNSPKFGYDPLQRRADTANDAKTPRGKTAALKTSLKMAKGNKGVAEGETSTPAIYVKGGGKYPGMTIAPKGWTRIRDIKDEGDSYFVMVGNDGDGLNIPKDKVSPHQIKLKNGMPITAKQAFMMFNGWTPDREQGAAAGSEDTVSFREMVDVVDKHYPKYYAELSGSNISDKQFEQKITSAYKKIMQKQGVAEADKHSFIGRIQRHNELKNKVDRTWRDAVDAENKGDKSGATRAFNKHVRYTNLERPGTWRTVKDQDQDITEMDKSEPSAGRDTGPRSGPDREAKPITSKQMQDRAFEKLKQSMSKPEHMAILKRLKTKESDTLMLKLNRALIKEGRVKELADDLKTMADADFMKKYGKAKAAIRRDMNKLDETPINELSTNKLAQYKTAAAKDAQTADKAGDVKRGDKRFSGIVKATKKQFDNDAKKVDESRAARRALMAQIVKGN